MCGIAGALGGRWLHQQGMARAVLVDVTERMKLRGPDAEGYWLDPSVGVGFGHRRLSLVDLSPAGVQPMHSHSGRFVLIFNGEIYNHRELRNRLELRATIPWRGHSDSEVLLECIDAWGIERALEQAVGMFAIGLWDRQTQQLTLARDRMGEKPLYYARCGQSFCFASELKGLRRFPEFNPEESRGAVAWLVQHGYVPEPHTIYKHAHKLPPGNLLTVSLNDSSEVVRPYWSLAESVCSARSQPFLGSDASALSVLEYELKRSVQQQLLADVPVGIFLSSGVDSSLITALAARVSRSQVRTFSIGFVTGQHNEATQAKRIAHHLGTEHAELYVTEDRAAETVKQLAQVYCEPIADTAQIPTLILAKFVRDEGITAALTGDGGDEVFCGYPRYLSQARDWTRLRQVPGVARSAFARLLPRIVPGAFEHIENNARYRAAKFGASLQARSPADYFERRSREFHPISELVIGCNDDRLKDTAADTVRNWSNPLEQVMVYDSLTTLPGALLTKVDRAAMSVSLETRSPFLDHRIVELAWRLPFDMKVRNGEQKWLLRQLLSRYLPAELAEGRKHGFNAPTALWLRGKLKPWAEQLLSPTELKQSGFFDPKVVDKLWREHQGGARNWAAALFAMAVFQNWRAVARAAV